MKKYSYYFYLIISIFASNLHAAHVPSNDEVRKSLLAGRCSGTPADTTSQQLLSISLKRAQASEDAQKTISELTTLAAADSTKEISQGDSSENSPRDSSCPNNFEDSTDQE